MVLRPFEICLWLESFYTGIVIEKSNIQPFHWSTGAYLDGDHIDGFNQQFNALNTVPPDTKATHFFYGNCSASLTLQAGLKMNIELRRNSDINFEATGYQTEFTFSNSNILPASYNGQQVTAQGILINRIIYIDPVVPPNPAGCVLSLVFDGYRIPITQPIIP